MWVNGFEFSNLKAGSTKLHIFHLAPRCARTMNLLELSYVVKDKGSAVAFLQCRGLLYERRICSRGHDMVLSLTDREDRWRWRHGGCDQQKQLKADTWLQRSRQLSLVSRRHFIYLLLGSSNEHHQTCEHELYIGYTTVVDYSDYLREICAQHLLATSL